MTIRVDENLLGTWYYKLGNEGDWLGALSTKEEGEYEFIYRHRHYMDDKTDSTSEDEKSWYKLEIPEKFTSDDQAILFIRNLVNQIAEFLRTEVHELLMDEEGPEGFAKRLLEQPFAHAEKHAVN
jgi:hypothetical protein